MTTPTTEPNQIERPTRVEVGMRFERPGEGLGALVVLSVEGDHCTIRYEKTGSVYGSCSNKGVLERRFLGWAPSPQIEAKALRAKGRCFNCNGVHAEAQCPPGWRKHEAPKAAPVVAPKRCHCGKPAGFGWRYENCEKHAADSERETAALMTSWEPLDPPQPQPLATFSLPGTFASQQRTYFTPTRTPSRGERR